jgi:hypothetical protein
MKVRVNSSGTSQVVSVGVQGPSGVTEINAAQDLDISNLSDGSMLVYSLQTEKWTATQLLEKQTMECGQY